MAIVICVFGFIPPKPGFIQRPGQRFHQKQTFSDSISTIIPFSKVGNLIIVKAVVDSIEGNFILDTGAPYLILNVVYFRDYPVTVLSDHEPTGMTGGATLVNRTNVKAFSFGELKYDFTDADLVDLGHTENRKGIKIL